MKLEPLYPVHALQLILSQFAIGWFWHGLACTGSHAPTRPSSCHPCLLDSEFLPASPPRASSISRDSRGETPESEAEAEDSEQCERSAVTVHAPQSPVGPSKGEASGAVGQREQRTPRHWQLVWTHTRLKA